MPDTHASNGLTASGSSRWLACTASVKLEQQFPSTSSSYAEEGTLAHEVAELTADYFLGRLSEDSYENKLAELSKNKYFTEEMRESAVTYAKLIRERFDKAKAACPDAFVALESRVDFSEYAPEGFGTADCVIIGEPVMEVIDFKYGKGVRVEAEGNTQMRLYALGALAAFGTFYECDTIRMTICQPRLSAISTDEISVKELLDWGKTVVKPAAEEALSDHGKFAPNENTCRFCKAKLQCKARAEMNLKLFDESPDADLLTPDEAGEILKKAGDIEAWIKDLRELVNTTLIHGEQVVGWKLVEGRSVRKLSDETKVVNALKAAGVEEALLYERKLITLTQMEKDFGKKWIGETLGDLIVKPRGTPTLAPESDKRPAYQPDDAVVAAFDEE